MNQDINTIIDQLAEIDSASASIMQKTQKEKSKYAEYIHQQKQQFDEALQKKVDAEVEEFQNSMDLQNKEQIEQYRIECNKSISKLDELFQNNSSLWADNIFNNIIKG